MTVPSATAGEAISAALVLDWDKAIALNTILLKENKADIDALCRLAYAQMKLGQFISAKRTYQKVLAIDQYNQIATKNLKKLGNLKKKDVATTAESTLSPMIFLEEPGKTKIVECVHVAPPGVLGTLSSGQEVAIKVKNHAVEIRSLNDAYLAALPDDLSFKLNKMIAGGNTYQAIVKNVDKKSFRILLRELSRGKRFAKQPSFISSTSYVAFSKSDKREKLDMTPTGEDAGEHDDVHEAADV